jgi:gamma-glutamyl:cysteine ligase YbdK (ATP-grasp superfamily)
MPVHSKIQDDSQMSIRDFFSPVEQEIYQRQVEKAAAEAAVAWALQNPPGVAAEKAAEKKQRRVMKNKNYQRASRLRRKEKEISEGIRDKDGLFLHRKCF